MQRQVSILEDYKNDILESKKLPAIAKQNTLNVLHCMISICKDSDFIQTVMDNKRSNKTKKSLQDSLHLKSFYNNGTWLAPLIQEMVDTIARLTPEQKLTFAKKICWNENYASLEVDVHAALEWANSRDFLPIYPNKIEHSNAINTGLGNVYLHYNNLNERKKVEEYLQSRFPEEKNIFTIKSCDHGSCSESCRKVVFSLNLFKNDMMQQFREWLLLYYEAPQGRYNIGLTGMQELIHVTRANALSLALLLTDSFGNNILSLAAGFLTSDSFQVLIAKVDAKALNSALMKQNIDGHCALFVVARAQNSAASRALVDKASPDALARASLLQLENDGRSAFSFIVERQASDAVQAFLDKLGSVKIYLNAEFEKNPKLFFDIFTPLSLYQPGKLILDFLRMLDSEFLDKMTALLTPENIDIYLSSRVLFAIDFKMQAVIENNSQISGEEKTLPITLDGAVIAFLQKCKAYKTSRLLSAHHAQTESKTEEKLSLEEKNVLECFVQGNAAIKIIRNNFPKHWPEFCDHLADYSKRQKLRPQSKPKKGYKYRFIVSPDSKEESKFPLAKGGIFAFNLRQQRAGKLNKKHDATTKTAMTVISKHLHTGLFGIEDSKREAVGIVCDITQCNLNTMLLRDRGTAERGWVQEELRNVIRYAQNIEHFSCVSLKEFKEKIDEQPHVVNEALVKITRESVLAIVIGEDTLAARRIALERQKNLESILKRPVPIVFYNSFQQKVRIYSQTEIFLDLIKTLSPEKDHEIILCNAFSLLEKGADPERLQKYYSLIQAYVQSPLHDKNRKFYKTVFERTKMFPQDPMNVYSVVIDAIVTFYNRPRATFFNISINIVDQESFILIHDLQRSDMASLESKAIRIDRFLKTNSSSKLGRWLLPYHTAFFAKVVKPGVAAEDVKRAQP